MQSNHRIEEQKKSGPSQVEHDNVEIKLYLKTVKQGKFCATIT